MKLVIVESPNKCKKIGQFLGAGYRLVATVGHFRDLPAKELAVDLETMLPTYEVDRKKVEVVKRLKAEAAKAEEVLIATDPDREGEAIGWHAAQVLGLEAPKRIEFHEITKTAIEKAVARLRPIDQALVDAQQARRVLDRLVGYKVSPLLQPLRKGLSAGRVQTATLHLVCQRERDRHAFKSEPFWVLKVTYENGLVSELAEETGKPRRPKDSSQLDALLAAAKRSPHLVTRIERKEVEKRSPPPFTTSTLQQAASARLGMVPAKTMKVAQELFEGGHISYHRTDSVALSPDAQALARLWISKHFPPSLPERPPVYRSKAGAQEAHEAIRPTSLAHPEGLTTDQKKLFELIRARFLASQMLPARLARTLVLTQSPAGEGTESQTFAARGTEVLEAHWLNLDQDDREQGQEKAGKGKKETSEDDLEEQKLPELRDGQGLEVKEATSQKRETKPPARFTEAGLVKEMERLGIGRPSTYAATIDTLYRRSYVKREKKALVPTGLGLQVDGLMLAGLPDLTSHEYTAGMELELDEIADGKKVWQGYLKGWWAAFQPRLEGARRVLAAEIRAMKSSGGREKAAGEGAFEGMPGGPDGPICPTCGAQMVQRKGKSGLFWGCSTYPTCRGTRSATTGPAQSGPDSTKKDGSSSRAREGKKPKAAAAPQEARIQAQSGGHGQEEGASQERPASDVKDLSEPARPAAAGPSKAPSTCPICGAPMKRREGKNGPFLGCSTYPKCRQTSPIEGEEGGNGSGKAVQAKASGKSAAGPSKAKIADQPPPKPASEGKSQKPKGDATGADAPGGAGAGKQAPAGDTPKAKPPARSAEPSTATAASSATSPSCPTCGAPMKRREGKNGPFWGCSTYPKCRQTLPIR
jgi:DNA topoisomerase-1